MIQIDIVQDVGFSWLWDDFWHGAIFFFLFYASILYV